MARYEPAPIVTKKGQGSKEASSFMESSFNGLSSALWMLVYLVVFVVETILTIVALALAAISTVTGWIAAAANAVAAATAKFAGIFSDLRDEAKSAFVNWKAKKDRIAARAKQLEAQEAV